MSLGDFDSGAVIYAKFTTFNPSTGAPFTLAGTPALSVYKDNSTTQTTTGVTLTVDFDGVTGLNHVTIDTSDSFYSAGSFFDVVITTGTVNSVSAVGSVVGRFTIRKTSALKPATAGRSLDVSSTGLVTLAGVTHTGAVIPTVTSVTNGVTASTVSDKTGYSLSSSQSFNTTGSVGSVTGAVGSVTGAVGSVTGNVGGSVASVTGNVGGNVVGSVASVTAGVTVTTNNDKTGYSLSSSQSFNTSGSVGSVTGAVGSVTAAVTVGTNNDKTGYSLTQAFPTNFQYLGINSSGHVSRVTLVDTTTTNTDMRGTDNAALASAWTATRAGYLDTVLLSGSVNRTVKVTGTGAGHIAADVHEFQTGVITTAAFAAGAIDAAALASDAVNEFADGLLDRANGIETGLTLRQALRLDTAALVGKLSGADGTTVTIRNVGDTTNRIVATVDSNGNRIAVTTDAT